SASVKKPGYFGSDVKEAFLALHLSRPLLGQRVYDLISVVTTLAEEKGIAGRPLYAVGVGKAGPVVLHAAVLDSRIQSVTLEQSLLSWTAVTRTPLAMDQLTNVVPGVLKVYDLPDLAAALAPRPLVLRSVVDPQQEPVTQAVLDETYAACRAAYERSGAGK